MELSRPEPRCRSPPGSGHLQSRVRKSGKAAACRAAEGEGKRTFIRSIKRRAGNIHHLLSADAEWLHMTAFLARSWRATTNRKRLPATQKRLQASTSSGPDFSRAAPATP